MEEKQNSRNISIVKDLNGNNIVIINDIVFKGKKSISWKDVEKYLMRYVGELYNRNLSLFYLSAKYTAYFYHIDF